MKIYELCDLRDRLEQYTRKNSLEIHGVPERAYESPEEVVIKIAEALEVPVHPNDNEIAHKLNRKGNKPIIVNFLSHKVKSTLYKSRAKLRNISVFNLFPNLSAAVRVASDRIFLNENLTSYRRKIINKANEMRRDGVLISVWSMDGKIFVMTSPEGRSIKIDEEIIINFVLRVLHITVIRLTNPWPSNSRLNWNLEMLIFVEGGKPENPEKNPRSKDENQQQTQPTYDTGSGNRTRATLVGGERDHHCAIPAPRFIIRVPILIHLVSRININL